MELSGTAAMVTGASGDIGRSIAVALAEAGCDVAVTYVGDRERAEATAGAVRNLGRAASLIQLDQRDEASIEAAAAAMADQHGRCDILVNNAAWNIGIPFPQLDLLDADTWDRVLETNLRGPYLASRALAPLLGANGAGRIVNIASVGGLYPGSSSIAYSCSKAGLIHLTHCLAVALAPAVAVNCVAPGLVEGTRMAARLPDEVAEGARRGAILGQVGSAADIAAATVMLCAADSISGQTIVVDGGNPGVMNFG
jgi:3-oxoacyl-[acyl-carrier protein] reductase